MRQGRSAWRPGPGVANTGHLGEAMAARHMEAEGWVILDRRWRDGPRELDLVALRDRVLAFVEVKTRRSGDLDELLLSVTTTKRKQLERAAGAWLRRFGAEHPRFAEVRFDVIGVQLPPGQKPQLHHVEAAWQR
jgi:putative endonuclease